MKKTIIIIMHAFIIWCLCGATIAIGSNLISMKTTLIIHAIGAPIFAAIVSYVYFKRYDFTNPIKTAIVFLLFIMIMDAGLVAPVFQGSYDMFKNIFGTWIPFGLIFLSTYFTGQFLMKNNES